MGGSSSKVELPEAPQFDYSKATVGLEAVEDLQEEAAAAVEKAKQIAADALSSNSSLIFWLKTIGGLSVFGLLAYLAYYYLWPMVSGYFGVSSGPRPSGGPFGSVYNNLSITNATTSGGNNVYDKIADKIDAGSGTVNRVVNEELGVSPGEVLTVDHKYTGHPSSTVTVKYGDTLVINPPSSSLGTAKVGTESGNQLTQAKDAKVLSTVSGSKAPLSDGNQGAYGYQFWMYVTDWSYRFGQDKEVISRADTTSSSIQNPRITLHPTDNTLKISVSVFPSSESSKSEPAPAGHSGATDDVFVCEVPDIPLQTWLAVSVTVSSRNLDVYLNGQLVKSCLLTGVPKPAVGDILLNKDGGFSGWMCSFYSYAKALTPSDASIFFSSGVPCSIPGDAAPTVSFGIFNSEGERVSKTVF
jgi:hypothetical protein